LVKAGAILFAIDPTPYEAQVRKIEAQLKFLELRLVQMTQLQAGVWRLRLNQETISAAPSRLRGSADGCAP
jgi:multidrug resistance efflux pump